jgi:hypothetical protein
MPLSSEMIRVCVRSSSMPTRRKSAPVVRAWLTMITSAPSSPMVVSVKIPSTRKPMCATDEYAMRRFRSRWRAATIDPYTMPMTDSTSSSGAKSTEASGKRVKE